MSASDGEFIATPGGKVTLADLGGGIRTEVCSGDRLTLVRLPLRTIAP